MRAQTITGTARKKNSARIIGFKRAHSVQSAGTAGTEPSRIEKNDMCLTIVVILNQYLSRIVQNSQGLWLVGAWSTGMQYCLFRELSPAGRCGQWCMDISMDISIA